MTDTINNSDIQIDLAGAVGEGLPLPEVQQPTEQVTEQVAQEDINPFRPRRVMIGEPWGPTFTGVFGTVDFVDGRSVHLVSHLEQQRLGGIIRIETVDEEQGSQIGPAAELVRSRQLSTDHPRVAAADSIVETPNGPRSAAASFDREELEQIADRKGLEGLRDIAKGLGIRGRSIGDLINRIMEAQGNNAQDGDA